ncbi:MAG: chorismate mutase [Alphaproteobacteria bacterium]|nr:chorismate mutase [Alphaproteobacteria bacterium]
MTSDVPSLSDLRREIDLVDDAVHDLLMRRAALVERVAAASNSEKPRLLPGREAQVVRRMLARHHGTLPKVVVVRIWRELFSALRSGRDSFALAVYMPKRGAGYLELAHEHYGSYTTATSYTSPSQVIRAVSDGSATIGILPMPQEDDKSAWWHTLMGDSATTPKIIARLPFAAPTIAGRGDGVEAMAIAQGVQDPAGDDHTLVVLETASGVSRASLRRVLTDAGLEECAYQGMRTVGDDVWLHLVEVTGYIPVDDERLRRLQADHGPVQRAAIIGSYAVPLSAAELGL